MHSYSKRSMFGVKVLKFPLVMDHHARRVLIPSVDINAAFPRCGILSPASNLGCAGGGGGSNATLYTACSADLTAPLRLHPPPRGSQTSMMPEEIKRKPIILNGLACSSRELADGEESG